jgi:hypothetical protein
LNCGVSSESVFVAKLWCQQRITELCFQKCELVFVAELWCWQQISFRYWIMVLAANQFCVVGSESVFAAKLCCSQGFSFRCRIAVSTVNQFSVPNGGVTSEPVLLTIMFSSESVR